MMPQRAQGVHARVVDFGAGKHGGNSTHDGGLCKTLKIPWHSKSFACFAGVILVKERVALWVLITKWPASNFIHWQKHHVGLVLPKARPPDDSLRRARGVQDFCRHGEGTLHEARYLVAGVDSLGLRRSKHVSLLDRGSLL